MHASTQRTDKSPALLEKLRGRQVVQGSSWKQVLLGSIEDLLNDAVRSARLPLQGLPHAYTSVVNHGLPPFAVVDWGVIDARAWALHIEDILRAHEPRLDPQTIRVSPFLHGDRKTMLAVVYRISASVRGPLPVAAVSFCIALDYSCRAVRLVSSE